MENFTSESLKRFINPEGVPQQAPPPGQEARSARGQRVSEVLRQHSGQGKPEAQNKNLDTLIRQNMGEMVRKYVQAGKFQELKVVMEEHKSFINEILKLVENSIKK